MTNPLLIFTAVVSLLPGLFIGYAGLCACIQLFLHVKHWWYQPLAIQRCIEKLKILREPNGYEKAIATYWEISQLLGDYKIPLTRVYGLSKRRLAKEFMLCHCRYVWELERELGRVRDKLQKDDLDCATAENCSQFCTLYYELRRAREATGWFSRLAKTRVPQPEPPIIEEYKMAYG